MYITVLCYTLLYLILYCIVQLVPHSVIYRIVLLFLLQCVWHLRCTLHAEKSSMYDVASSTIRYILSFYSTVQYSTIWCSTVQYGTVQYSTVQYSTVKFCTLQYGSLLCYADMQSVQFSRINSQTLLHRHLPYIPSEQYSTVLCSTV